MKFYFEGSISSVLKDTIKVCGFELSLNENLIKIQPGQLENSLLENLIYTFNIIIVNLKSK